MNQGQKQKGFSSNNHNYRNNTAYYRKWKMLDIELYLLHINNKYEKAVHSGLLAKRNTMSLPSTPDTYNVLNL